MAHEHWVVAEETIAFAVKRYDGVSPEPVLADKKVRSSKAAKSAAVAKDAAKSKVSAKPKVAKAKTATARAGKKVIKSTAVPHGATAH